LLPPSYTTNRDTTETRVWAAHHPDDPKRIVSRPIPQDLIDRFK